MATRQIEIGELDRVDRELLNFFQRDFPLVARPFAEIGNRLGVAEEDVIERLERLDAAGAVSRVGAVVAPHRSGWSTLAAMSVPTERLDEVADLVGSYDEVNHNYEREHRFNLWFVVGAADKERVAFVLREIADRTGLDVLDLPLVESFRLDLGFPLQWS